jgi:predicted nucleic acid-binding protein
VVKIVLDTSACIYLLDGGDRQRKVRASIAGEHTLLISTVTVAELLVAPIRSDDPVALAQADALIEMLEVVTASEAIARAAAAVRAAHGRIKMPDALIIATAAACGADRVIGNDRGWVGVCSNLELVDA